MKWDFERIEALAQIHPENREEIEKRVQSIIQYVGQLQKIDLPAKAVPDSLRMEAGTDIAEERSFDGCKPQIHQNTPQLSEAGVVVPKFIS